MPSLYATLLAFLVGVNLTHAVGLENRQSSCSAVASNFSMLANVSSTQTMYGQVTLGGVCQRLFCGLYFIANGSETRDTFTIDDDGFIAIVSDFHPHKPPIGFLGYVTGTDENDGEVYFGRPKSLIRHKHYRRKLRCALEDDPDGSCNVQCSRGLPDGTRLSGSTIADDYHNAWLVGDESGDSDLVPVLVKAVLPPT